MGLPKRMETSSGSASIVELSSGVDSATEVCASAVPATAISNATAAAMPFVRCLFIVCRLL
jgi:hypothetical protein